MTGSDARALRRRLGIPQNKMSWDLALDPSLLSRYELGYYRMKPETEAAIEKYLSRQLEEIRNLEIPRGAVAQ
jgi:hypothetical protein